MGLSIQFYITNTLYCLFLVRQEGIQDYAYFQVVNGGGEESGKASEH